MYLRGPGWLNSYKPITNTAWVRGRLCKLQKRCTRFAAASDKVYPLLAHDRWFSPGIPAFFTTKTSRHYIANILLKVALSTINQIKSMYLMYVHVYIWHQCTMYFVSDLYALAFSVQSTYTHLPWVYNVHCVRTCTHLPSGTMCFVFVHVHTYLRCTMYFVYVNVHTYLRFIMHFVYVHVHLPSVCNVLCVRTCTHFSSVYNVFCLCTCTHLPSVYIHVHTKCLAFGAQCRYHI